MHSTSDSSYIPCLGFTISLVLVIVWVFNIVLFLLHVRVSAGVVIFLVFLFGFVVTFSLKVINCVCGFLCIFLPYDLFVLVGALNSTLSIC
jgi:tryptophan-rich sensory protein